MTTSIDGRIVVDSWPLDPADRAQYEAVHGSYDPDGWICGRITMEHFAGGMVPLHPEETLHRGAERPDFRAPDVEGPFAFAVDASGRLDWTTNEVGGDHVVAILGNQVPDAYLAKLRGLGVSYILGGSQELDLGLALRKIRSQYQVETLMLEGGGGINGSFLKAGLIDEISLLLAPVADGRVGTPALFDVAGDPMPPKALSLLAAERRGGSLWLRYKLA